MIIFPLYFCPHSLICVRVRCCNHFCLLFMQAVFCHFCLHVVLLHITFILMKQFFFSLEKDEEAKSRIGFVLLNIKL